MRPVIPNRPMSVEGYTYKRNSEEVQDVEGRVERREVEMSCGGGGVEE
jgi:hypothetical protein